MELSKEKLKVIVEALIFASSADACLDSDKFDSRLAVELAAELNDESFDLACYLYKGSDEYYDDDVSVIIENGIKQIRVET